MNNIFEQLRAIQGRRIETVHYENHTHEGVESITINFIDGASITLKAAVSFHGNDEYPAEAVITV